MAQKKQIEVSIVVPVYNSSNTLEELYGRISHSLDNKFNFELIFVDDGSQDQSWKILEKLRASDRRVKIIQLIRNFGQQNAIICGFEHILGKYAVTMDDDLQHSPEDIPKLVGHMERKNLDVVIGSFEKKAHGLGKNVGSKFMDLIYRKVFRKPKNLQLTSFRVLRKEISDQLLRIRTVHPAIGPMILSLTTRIENVRVSHKPRGNGRSGYNILKNINLAFDVLTNYSSFPLKVMSAVGLIVALSGFVLAIYLVIHWFFYRSNIAGWTSLIILNLTFFGLVLLSLGVIGEYLIRISGQVMNAPLYVIKKKRIRP